MSAPPAGSRTALYFVLAGASWGLGFMFIRVAVTGVSPLTFVFARTLIATVVLGGIMAVSGRTWPRGLRAWRRLTVLSVFGMALPFLLYAWAGQRVPSGLSAVYNAAVPLSTVFLATVVMRLERPSGRKLLGILLAGAGVLVVLAPWDLAGTRFDLAGQLACIAAVLLLGFAFSYTRRAITPLGLDPIATAASQTLVTAVLSAAVLPFSGDVGIEPSAPVILSIIAVGLMSTGFAYVWNFRVIERWGAASASMTTYLTTVVGVIAGVLVLGEGLALNQLLGAGVVLLGVAVGVNPRRDQSSQSGSGPSTS